MFLGVQPDQKPATRREDQLAVTRVRKKKKRCYRSLEGRGTRRRYQWFLKINLLMLILIAPNLARTKILRCPISTRRTKSLAVSFSHKGCNWVDHKWTSSLMTHHIERATISPNITSSLTCQEHLWSDSSQSTSYQQSAKDLTKKLWVGEVY